MGKLLLGQLHKDEGATTGFWCFVEGCLNVQPDLTWNWASSGVKGRLFVHLGAIETSCEHNTIIFNNSESLI